MTAPGERGCYLPMCALLARWTVTDTSGEGARGACDGHLPKLVHRLGRKMRVGQLVIAPAFTVHTVFELAPLLLIGAEVYGMVVDTAGAGAVAAMTPEQRSTMVEAATRPVGLARLLTDLGDGLGGAGVSHVRLIGEDDERFADVDRTGVETP